tara:strand:- start:116 stop:232 length:117 start_codon:yes stop_codon:yes gene_type:complete
VRWRGKKKERKEGVEERKKGRKMDRRKMEREEEIESDI